MGKNEKKVSKNIKLQCRVSGSGRPKITGSGSSPLADSHRKKFVKERVGKLETAEGVLKLKDYFRSIVKSKIYVYAMFYTLVNPIKSNNFLVTNPN